LCDWLGFNANGVRAPAMRVACGSFLFFSLSSLARFLLPFYLSEGIFFLLNDFLEWHFVFQFVYLLNLFYCYYCSVG
jgi:hypothetical protein